MPRLQRLWLWLCKKRRLPLRIRLALWSGLLVLLLSFILLLFINWVALSAFPRIVRGNILPQLRAAYIAQHGHVPPSSTYFRDRRATNPLEDALLLELRSISLIGLGFVALIGGVSAYFMAGLTLRPVRKVSKAAQRISANTLNTRLALDGPKDEVKELADTFDAMLGRLQQTFDQQSRVGGGGAHELRTPLASLRTNLEVVTTDDNATLDDYREMADAQERALNRLESVVADLLILAKSEQPIAHTDVSLNALIEEVISDLTQRASEHGVTIRLISATEIVIPGNETLLARVFSNLIENGINYNLSGGEVLVMLDRKECLAVVNISDTGIGMSPETQPHIFDRFYRADSSRSRHTGGVGLGLSIVTAIVQQHSGQVGVTSNPGTGSTFTVSLPLSTV
ncbi:MAG: sensor histidine kinase [Ktedonobacteraceae bacterium]